MYTFTVHNDPVSNSDYTMYNRWESEKMRKEAVVAYFQALSRNLPEGTEKTANNLSLETES
jgi:quinol monooxygenase YgiN